MTAASITVRVDEATKQSAASIVEDFGFDLSSATRAFCRSRAENLLEPRIS